MRPFPLHTLPAVCGLSVSSCEACIHTTIFLAAINEAIFHNLSNSLILVGSEAACCKEHHNLTPRSRRIISSCWLNISGSLCCEDPEQTVLHSHFPWPSSFHWPSSYPASVSPFRPQSYLVSLHMKAAPHWTSLSSSYTTYNSNTSLSEVAMTLMTSSR